MSPPAMEAGLAAVAATATMMAIAAAALEIGVIVATTLAMIQVISARIQVDVAKPMAVVVQDRKGPASAGLFADGDRFPADPGIGSRQTIKDDCFQPMESTDDDHNSI